MEGIEEQVEAVVFQWGSTLGRGKLHGRSSLLLLWGQAKCQGHSWKNYSLYGLDTRGLGWEQPKGKSQRKSPTFCLPASRADP